MLEINVIQLKNSFQKLCFKKQLKEISLNAETQGIKKQRETQHKINIITHVHIHDWFLPIFNLGCIHLLLL